MSTQLPDICRNKHGGSPTSEAANIRVHSHKEADRRRILAYADVMGGYGITVHEIGDALGKTPNCVSGRLTELKKDGLLSPNGKKRNRAAVLVLSNGQLPLWG